MKPLLVFLIFVVIGCECCVSKPKPLPELCHETIDHVIVCPAPKAVK